MNLIAILSPIHKDLYTYIMAKDGFKIESVWAFIFVHDDGDEGIPAFDNGTGIAQPMVGADEKRVPELKLIAQDIANQYKRELKFVRFILRDDIETIKPQ